MELLNSNGTTNSSRRRKMHPNSPKRKKKLKCWLQSTNKLPINSSKSNKSNDQILYLFLKQNLITYEKQKNNYIRKYCVMLDSICLFWLYSYDRGGIDWSTCLIFIPFHRTVWEIYLIQWGEWNEGQTQSDHREASTRRQHSLNYVTQSQITIRQYIEW